MDIRLRADSARAAGIGIAEDAEQFVATLPDRPRPEQYRDDEFSLAPRLDDDGRLHLYLSDPIDDWFGVNNEHLVAALAGVPDAAPIVLHVNCPGGSVFHARAMQGTLLGRDVEARVEGMAASAASWLILSAARRSMTVGSRVVIHETRLRFRGCTTELRHVLPVLEATDVEVSEDYATATGRDAGEWLAMMQEGGGVGTEFGAARAKELGLVGEVIASAKPLRENKASTRVDAQSRLAVLRLQEERWD